MDRDSLADREQQRARAWRRLAWGSLVVVAPFAAIMPLGMPMPTGWAYAIMLPAYLVSFVLGVRYKASRPVDDAAPPRRLTRRMYVIGGVIPAVVMVIGSVLRPNGPLVPYAMNLMFCIVVFFLGESFAIRNRVPAGFRP